MPRLPQNNNALTQRQIFAQQAMMYNQMMLAKRRAQMGGVGASPGPNVDSSLLQTDPRFKRPGRAMMPQRGQYQGPGAYVPPKPIPNKVAANPKLKRPNQPIEVLPTPRMDRMPGGNGPEPLIPRERYMNTKPSGIQKLPSPKRDRMPDLRQDTHPYIPD